MATFSLESVPLEAIRAHMTLVWGPYNVSKPFGSPKNSKQTLWAPFWRPSVVQFERQFEPKMPFDEIFRGSGMSCECHIFSTENRGMTCWLVLNILFFIFPPLTSRFCTFSWKNNSHTSHTTPHYSSVRSLEHVFSFIFCKGSHKKSSFRQDGIQFGSPRPHKWIVVWKRSMYFRIWTFKYVFLVIFHAKTVKFDQTTSNSK